MAAVLYEISARAYERFAVYQCIFAYNLTLVAVDSFDNKVVVGIAQYNERMIEGFRRYVLDSPVLVFRQMGPFDLGGGQGSLVYGILILIGVVLVAVWIAVAIMRRRTRRRGRTQFASLDCGHSRCAVGRGSPTLRRMSDFRF